MEGRHGAQVGGLLGKKVSPCLNLPQARAYKSFKIGELYSKVNLHKVKADKRAVTSETQDAEHPLPLVNAKYGDNGIMFYGKSDCFESAEMTIDIIQNGAIATGKVYPQPQKTGVLWDAYLIKAKHHKDTEQTLIYIACAIEKAIRPRYDRDKKATWDRVSEEKVMLPVRDDGEIDFDYMEAYIRELESARIHALDAYLAAAGFDNCELTEEEQNAVDAIANGKVKTNKFKIADLFSVETPKRRFNANAVKFGGTHPYVVRTSQNNGQRGTIIADEKWLNSSDTISFGQDTATIFYQPDAYFTGDKIKVMKWQSGPLGESVACYCLATMRKAFSTFAWGRSSFNEKVLKDVVVSLPVTLSGEVDHAFMETFIRGMMKRAISGVVAWKDHELAATKQVIGIGEAKKGNR